MNLTKQQPSSIQHVRDLSVASDKASMWPYCGIADYQGLLCYCNHDGQTMSGRRLCEASRLWKTRLLQICRPSPLSSGHFSNSVFSFTMVKYVVMRHPFPLLSSSKIISFGSSGRIFAITASIVFKCPHLLEDDGSLTAGDKYRMIASVQSMENEKKILDTLKSHPHPNVLHAILCVPEGIFMPRLEMNLATRLAIPYIADHDIRERWIIQIVSAAAWLEKLGYAHGDLRPANILVDKFDDIRIADFDATVTFGSELQAATLPFCKVDKDFETPLAGPESEQFALGSIIYNIRYGIAPLSDLELESPVWSKMFAHGEYPSTPDDRYGDIIQKCWQGAFPSISALQIEIEKLTTVQLVAPKQPARHHAWHLLAQCQEYVTRQHLLLGGHIAWRFQLRCRLFMWYTVRAVLSAFQ